MAAAVIAIAALLALALAVAAQWLAPRVPFAVETRLASRFSSDVGKAGPVESYLRALGQRIARAQQLPADIEIHVHFRQENTVNALATLGGHIVIYRGLVDVLPDENTLAMVLAHEIAHVHHRHPITALGRGIAIAAVMSTLSSVAGSSVAGRVLGETGLLTQLSFSRAQEEAADATAVASLVHMYGHAGGSGELFGIMRKASRQPGELPRILSTHPLSDERTARVTQLVQTRAWAPDGPRTALPAELRGDRRDQR